MEPRMTDWQQLKQMFDNAGVEYEERPETGDIIVFASPLSDTNLGYEGFHSEFTFDGDGNLLSVGSWE